MAQPTWYRWGNRAGVWGQGRGGLAADREAGGGVAADREAGGGGWQLTTRLRGARQLTARKRSQATGSQTFVVTMLPEMNQESPPSGNAPSHSESQRKMAKDVLFWKVPVILSLLKNTGTH